MACDEAAGIVVGTFFGTLFLVAVILGVAFLVWRRRLTQGKLVKVYNVKCDICMYIGRIPCMNIVQFMFLDDRI